MQIKIIIAVLLCFLCAFLVVASDPISVSGLGEGDRLEVKYTSTGCFHKFSCQIVFTKGYAEVFDGNWENSVWSYEKQRGKLELEKSDLKKLDKLFAFYANNPGGGCTTVDEIFVKRFKADKLVSTDQFSDGSCRVDEEKGVLTFLSLIARLKEVK